MSLVKSISKGLSAVGNALNSITGVNSQTDKTYKQQMSAMEAQNAYNTYMWNLANQYNTPAAQLARMKEAGIDINPTSYALGTGNLSNTAGTISSASGFSGSGSPAGNPISMAMGVANGIQGIRESKARTENMHKQNDNLDGVITATRLENEIRRHNLEIGRDTNSPVGTTPSMDATLTREGTTLWNILKGSWAKARSNYVKSHPDYKGW